MAVYVLGGVSLLAGTMGNAGNLKTYAAERTEIRLDSQETYYSYHGLKKIREVFSGFRRSIKIPRFAGGLAKAAGEGNGIPR